MQKGVIMVPNLLLAMVPNLLDSRERFLGKSGHQFRTLFITKLFTTTLLLASA
jgi:hypothetical protein